MEKVEPFDIDSLLGKVKNKVVKVGVELEGAWKTLPADVGGLEHDGSVFRNKRPPGYQVGELPIGPVPPAVIGKLIGKNYPDKINDTCGMHVHMSFETLWYFNLLMIPEYQETVAHYLSIWAKKEGFAPDDFIWKRLAGKSQYCVKEFWPDLQASTKRKGHDMTRPGHRYTMIHYCGRLLTIECRVLPMFDTVDQAIRAVHEVINITNACIHLLGTKDRSQRRISGKLELPNTNIYEEYIEENIF